LEFTRFYFFFISRWRLTFFFFFTS
jgi:hypothetical protein